MRHAVAEAGAEVVLNRGRRRTSSAPSPRCVAAGHAVHRLRLRRDRPRRGSRGQSKESKPRSGRSISSSTMPASSAARRWSSSPTRDLAGADGDQSRRRLLPSARRSRRRMIPRGRARSSTPARSAASSPAPTIAPYTASKGAVKMLTKAMCVEWAKHGIQVNGIGPGYFKTELNPRSPTTRTSTLGSRGARPPAAGASSTSSWASRCCSPRTRPVSSTARSSMSTAGSPR